MLTNRELRKRAKNIIDFKGILIMSLIAFTSIYLTLKISPIISTILWNMIDKIEGIRSIVLKEHITIISIYISINVVSMISGYFATSVILDITEENKLTLETFKKRIGKLSTYLKVKLINVLFGTITGIITIVIEIILFFIVFLSYVGGLKSFADGSGSRLTIFLLFLVTIIMLAFPIIVFAYLYAKTYALGYIVLEDERNLTVKEVFKINKNIVKGNGLKVTFLILTFLPLMALSLVTLGVLAIYIVPLLMVTMALKYKDIVDSNYTEGII